jgi:hypothetical protein
MMGRQKQREKKPKGQITVMETPLVQIQIAAQTAGLTDQIVSAAAQGIVMRNSAFDEEQVVSAARNFGRNYSVGMARTDYLQHSDKNLTMMIQAAALSAPDTWIQHDELPSPYGICVFEEPIVPEPMYQMPVPISAISWGLLQFRTKNAFGQREETDNGILLQIAWGLLGGKITPLGMMCSGIGRELEKDVEVKEALDAATTQGRVPLIPSILRSLSVLNRLPLAKVENVEASNALRDKAKVKGVTNTLVRRSYLRKPEQGKLELDAAVDNLYGRPTRGHWVRGFWRQQWYPSTKEYRRIWVEGYARGDFSLGVVSGPKVLVGKGDLPEAVESPSIPG